MTARLETRERRVWALAKGSDLPVLDDNLPPVPKVGPNKEGARQHYKRATELGAEPDSALEQMLK